MKRLLFICSLNKWRSPTAEHIFADYLNIETDSAGLNRGAEVRLDTAQIEWTDIIFVMEKKHHKKLNETFREYLTEKKIVVLHIPDKYQYMDKDLVRLIKERCAPYLA